MTAFGLTKFCVRMQKLHIVIRIEIDQYGKTYRDTFFFPYRPALQWIHNCFYIGQLSHINKFVYTKIAALDLTISDVLTSHGFDTQRTCLLIKLKHLLGWIHLWSGVSLKHVAQRLGFLRPRFTELMWETCFRIKQAHWSKEHNVSCHS